jgi:hypothetical protein
MASFTTQSGRLRNMQVMARREERRLRYLILIL